MVTALELFVLNFESRIIKKRYIFRLNIKFSVFVIIGKDIIY